MYTPKYHTVNALYLLAGWLLIMIYIVLKYRPDKHPTSLNIWSHTNFEAREYSRDLHSLHKEIRSQILYAPCQHWIHASKIHPPCMYCIHNNTYVDTCRRPKVSCNICVLIGRPRWPQTNQNKPRYSSFYSLHGCVRLASLCLPRGWAPDKS